MRTMTKEEQRISEMGVHELAKEVSEGLPGALSIMGLSRPGDMGNYKVLYATDPHNVSEIEHLSGGTFDDTLTFLRGMLAAIKLAKKA